MKKVMAVLAAVVVVLTVGMPTVFANHPEGATEVVYLEGGHKNNVTEECTDVQAPEGRCKKIVDKKFMFMHVAGLENETEVTVRFQYLDRGNGSFKPAYLSDTGKYYWELEVVQLADSNTWKTYQVVLKGDATKEVPVPAPKFTHFGADHDDLRIQSLSGDVYISNVTAVAGAAVAVETPASNEQTIADADTKVVAETTATSSQAPSDAPASEKQEASASEKNPKTGDYGFLLSLAALVGSLAVLVIIIKGKRFGHLD